MGSGTGKSRRTSATATPHRYTTAELLKKYPYQETKLYEVALATVFDLEWRKALPLASPFIYATGPRGAPDSIHAEAPHHILRGVLGKSNCQVSEELASAIIASPTALAAAEELAGRYYGRFNGLLEPSEKNIINVCGSPGPVVEEVYAALAEGFYCGLVGTLTQNTGIKRLGEEFKKVSF